MSRNPRNHSWINHLVRISRCQWVCTFPFRRLDKPLTLPRSCRRKESSRPSTSASPWKLSSSEILYLHFSMGTFATGGKQDLLVGFFFCLWRGRRLIRIIERLDIGAFPQHLVNRSFLIPFCHHPCYFCVHKLFQSIQLQCKAKQRALIEHIGHIW